MFVGACPLVWEKAQRNKHAVKILDSLLLMLLICGAYCGFKRGLVLELFSMGSFFVATIGSVRLFDWLVSFYVKWYGPLGNIIRYAIFVLLFMMIVIVVTLLGRLFRHWLKRTLLGNVDQVIGALLGIFKWAFALSMLVWLGNLLHFKIPPIYTTDTLIFPIIEVLAPKLVTWLFAWLPALQAWFGTIYEVDLD